MTTEPNDRTVRALERLLEDGRRSVWTASGGDQLSEYYQGHLRAMRYASDGTETRDRIYKLAQQVGFAPVVGRIGYLAGGYPDPLVRLEANS